MGIMMKMGMKMTKIRQTRMLMMTAVAKMTNDGDDMAACKHRK